MNGDVSNSVAQIRRSYAKTQLAMHSNPLVKSRFHKRFIERLRRLGRRRAHLPRSRGLIEW